MGLEFMPIFKDWAADYDNEVNGGNPEYREVFEGYWDILDRIVTASSSRVLEFGSGTGNLTERLLAAGKTVFPVEPSPEMRQIAAHKPRLRFVEFIEGDMENFPKPAKPIDTIVSNLVFHHLSANEKERAIGEYRKLLPVGGQIIFGDTMFLSKETYAKILAEEDALGRQALVEDLQREYYPLVTELEEYFSNNGFQTIFQQMNRFVWIVKATKIA